MSFLTIPSEEGLFTTIKCRKSAGESGSRFPVEYMEVSDGGDDDDEDDEDDDNTEDVHLIPRSSPVPRKRGSSIHDETEEYMRIHRALCTGKRVSFADTTGGDLVDVKEFAAHDPEEGDSARWEEEEAKYRRPLQREPTYRVRPEFDAPADGDLLRAVRANKLEVEQVSPVEQEPLAFSGVVRVLNVSFHKAVYIRSTMDSWATYFDHPAEYLRGSHDGDTDRFSFKLSFAPPYVAHGARMEFVVRYETSDGDYWANNSSANYAVTLLLSYEEDEFLQRAASAQEIRGILKPPKAHSMIDDFDSEDEREGEEAEARTFTAGLVRPTVVYPAVIVQPEIDVEITVQPPGSSVPPNQELPSGDGTLSAHTGEQFPSMSPETTLQTNSLFALCASESAPPRDEPWPLATTRRGDLGKQTSDSVPFALLPASAPSQLRHESRRRPDSSGAGREESRPSEASCMRPPAAEADPRPAAAAAGEDVPTDGPTSCPRVEPPAERVSAAPSVVRGFKQEVAVGASADLVAGLSGGSTGSAARHDGSGPAAESRASLLAKGEAPPTPELTEDSSASSGVTETSQNAALRSVSAAREEEEEEEEDAPQIPPDTSILESRPCNTPPEASIRLQPERRVQRSLKPTVVFLSGAVSLLVALRDPGVLFPIGLLLLLRRLGF